MELSDLAGSVRPSCMDNNSIFDGLKTDMNYSQPLEQVVRETVAELLDRETSASRPGMLLGKVQSGKTRVFIGVIGHAFDQGFDIAVVLTKGTTALARQTVSRLQKEFRRARDNDQIMVHDVMRLPTRFNRWEAGRKLIVVCKKQKDNLRNLKALLTNETFRQEGRRVLFIDDEADYASVGFKRTSGEVTVATIAASIDELRQELRVGDRAPAFLQVTATPYSLYLQPETIEVGGKSYERVRPSFTKLVPVHSAYVGSEFFFDEEHLLHELGQSCFQPIEDADELSALKSEDGRRVKKSTVLTAKAVRTVRAAVVQFVVGASIRRLQATIAGERPAKYSFIVHTETGKPSHAWQVKLFDWVVDALRASQHEPMVQAFVQEAYDALASSVALANAAMPPLADVRRLFGEMIDAIKIEVVNSEKDVENMLDDEGQLRLTSPLNLFVGGQILDRGITIANLIGFFYGRNPKKFQQDTVLQHARLFGARPLLDLAVTRFYTTRAIRRVFGVIHEIDTALRDAFERGGQEGGVVFIQRDMQNQIIPCSPNKILLSSAVTLRPHRRVLPVGFNTCKPSRDTARKIKALDKAIDQETGTDVMRESKLLPVDMVVGWLRQIEETLEFDAGEGFDWDAMRAALDYLANKPRVQGMVHVLVRTERSIKRKRKQGAGWRYSNAPDTAQREGEIARELSAGQTPVLMLIRQEGTEDKGWNGCPFWWPVLMTPKQMKPVIVSTESTDLDSDDTEVDAD